jgi:hypothetical protein
MKKFKQILLLIAEAKLEPGGEDIGKLFGPRGKYSPNAKDAPGESSFNPGKELTYLARIRSGNIQRPPMPSEPTPSRTKKPSAGKRPTGSFPVVTNNMHHDGHLMRMMENDRELREMMKSVSPKFMKHSDALTSALREYHESTGGKASKYERGLYAHNLITSHLDTLADKLGNLNSKGLPIKEKFGKARISHTSQDTSVPGERTLKIHFHPLKTYISGAGQIKELTQHLEKKTGHAWYIHLDSGQQGVGTKRSPLVLASAINHPWLRGEDDGGDDDGNKPVTPKPRNPKGKQPTGPKAPTRPRMPSLV